MFIFLIKEKDSKISKEKDPANKPFRWIQNIFQDDAPEEKTSDSTDGVPKLICPTYSTWHTDPKVQRHPRSQVECQFNQWGAI